MRGWTLGVLLATLAAGFASGACTPDVSQAVDDATLAANVRTALVNDPTVGAERIDVDVRKGVVTLSGTVAAPADEQRAITLARGVNGVTRVESHLQVQPPARAAMPIHPF